MLRGLAPPVPAGGFPQVLILLTQLVHQSSAHTPSFLRLSGYSPWSLGPSALYSYSFTVSEAVKVKLQDVLFFTRRMSAKENTRWSWQEGEWCCSEVAGGSDGRGGTLGMSFGGYTHFCFDQSSLGFLSAYS